MRKGFLAICSVLLVLIISIALLVPSCAPTTGTIEVKATLCGVAWQGAVNYTLTPASGSAFTGNIVPKTFTVAPGTWTCGSVVGGPAGAFLNSIKPSASQSLVAGGTITFTLDFELNQDAAIVLPLLPWTVNGIPIQGPPYYYELGAVCNTIDVHFLQWVNGCPGYNVTLNETSKLYIHYDGYVGGPPNPPVTLHVVNADCAVNKTLQGQGLLPVKKSQVASFKGIPVHPGMEDIPLNFCDDSAYLDVETQWQLVKCLNYTKSINWFGISLFMPSPGHECVLFELVLSAPGTYHFTLHAEAELKLVDDVDVNPGNNKVVSLPLSLTVVVPP
jgi:hypothetical protein